MNAESNEDAENEAKRINDSIEGCEIVTTTDITREF